MKFKTFFILFLIILAPNILRQVVYYSTFLKTGEIGFIDSFETRAIYTSFPFLGVIEELIIGLIFTVFWFFNDIFRRVNWLRKFGKLNWLRFFAYGWISDALIDFIFVLLWFLFGNWWWYLLSPIIRFFTREIFLSYAIFGPVLYKFGFGIRRLSLYYSLFGVLVLLLVIM